MISLVSHLMGMPRTRMELARAAIHLEQELLRENVGVQDQLHASFGGINRFESHGDSVRIAPVAISGHDLRVLRCRLLSMPRSRSSRMPGSATTRRLGSAGYCTRGGRSTKRPSSHITAPGIDDLYEFCLANGAIGGKLCGAGGGGFLLVVVPPERRADFGQAIGGGPGVGAWR